MLCRYLRLQSNSCGQVRGVDVASWPAKTEFRQRISPAISERAGGDSSSQATCLHAAASLRAPSGRASTVPICVGLCLRVASVDTARHSTSRLQQASADALGGKKFAMQAWHASSTRSLLPMVNKRSSNTITQQQAAARHQSLPRYRGFCAAQHSVAASEGAGSASSPQSQQSLHLRGSRPLLAVAGC